MTKEEAIETIKDICLTTKQLERVEKALECLLSTPSLPSNLDEAELKHVEFSDCPPANQEEDLMVYNAFKAGAEWMAGQFQKIEDIAEDHSTNFKKMAKEAEALDALADWWIENYCNKDAGFDESSFHIGFCLGWQQHEKGMTAVENLKAKKKVQDNPAPEKLIKNKS